MLSLVVGLAELPQPSSLGFPTPLHPPSTLVKASRGGAYLFDNVLLGVVKLANESFYAIGHLLPGVSDLSVGFV